METYKTHWNLPASKCQTISVIRSPKDNDQESSKKFINTTLCYQNLLPTTKKINCDILVTEKLYIFIRTRLMMAWTGN